MMMIFWNASFKQKKDLEDASWAYYSDNYFVRAVYLSRIENALKMAPDCFGQKILEVGIGCGITLPTFAFYGKIVGIDSNNKFIRKSSKFCKKNGIECELIKADILDFKYKKNYFDTIFCLSVLEHINDVESALHNIKSMLKKNGVFILGLPIEKFLVNTLFKIVGISKEVKKLHITNYEKIENILKEKFIIEETKKIPFSWLTDQISLYKIYKCTLR